ncbi:MAG: hypothetical protein NT075_07385 [Chloroflexi bacterium]|nr:hypothetical protein [Chloroflexota bacterium]
MPIYQKLEALKAAYFDENDFEQVVDKILDGALSQYHLRLARYEQELHLFEEKFGQDSDTFYQHFQNGQLGDEMDFFEWAGLYKLRQDILQKIQRLELAL